MVARGWRGGQSGEAALRLASARRRSRRKKSEPATAMATPTRRATGSGSRRTRKPTAETAPKIRRPLNALSLGLATLEFLDDAGPLATFAQQPLDHFPKRSLAAARGELPLRRLAHLGRRVGGRGGDAGALHRPKVGQIVADVNDLIERHLEPLQQLGARL